MGCFKSKEGVRASAKSDVVLHGESKVDESTDQQISRVASDVSSGPSDRRPKMLHILTEGSVHLIDQDVPAAHHLSDGVDSFAARLKRKSSPSASSGKAILKKRSSSSSLEFHPPSLWVYSYPSPHGCALPHGAPRLPKCCGSCIAPSCAFDDQQPKRILPVFILHPSS